MADEETVNVTLHLIGQNNAGFSHELLNVNKNISKAAYAVIQKLGAQLLLDITDALSGPAPKK